MKLQRGFTLIEIAIVLAIATLLSGIGVQALSAMVRNSQTSQIRASFDTIKGAIIWQSVQNRTCDSPQVPPCTTAQFTYPMPAAGTPTTAMGIAASVVTDPWQHPYTYTMGAAILNVASLPGDTAFTLRSLGPDGIPNNADDTVLVVTVAEVRSLVIKLS